MKNILGYIVVAFTASFAWSQSSPQPKHEWRATVKVVDENSKPVPNANVDIWYYVTPPPGQTEASEKIHGLTDKKGLFVASHEDTGSVTLGFQVKKAGYYGTTRGYTLGMSYQYNPVKWSPEINMVLKAVGKPIAMYAKSIISMKFPVLNKPIGYDLMAGDWVAPYGKGVSSDFLFTENHVDKSGYSFAVSFPNQGDGIQEFDVPLLLQDATTGLSDLRSSSEAPPDGYQPTFVQINHASNRNFYFRIRTKLDENGNVVSARYGKIYGDLPQFTYYYNPTPNDRNVEFDSKQNLLGSLRSFEQATAP
jgi:hypothetical protein